MIYFKDAQSLYVNLYVPSQVTWTGPGAGAAPVKVTQETNYPEAETTTLTLEGAGRFALKLRIPGWCSDASVKINGAVAPAECKAGQWAVIDRAWASGDKVELRIPLAFRYAAGGQAASGPGGDGAGRW